MEPDPADVPASGIGIVNIANALTVFRLLLVPVFLVFMFAGSGHDPAWRYAATAVFAVAAFTDRIDGELARRRGLITDFGKLLDPIADKVLVLGAMIMLIGEHVVPAWMIAAIVVREVMITGLRQAAIERGIVIAARDLGKLKTWAQAIAVALGGFAAAGAWSSGVAWWSMLVAVVLTWASGLDYARSAPQLFRARPV
jgi:CDP-diacylglycerol--glycerol-3-phosphate 3-phosphatidyltransferase